MSTDEGWLLDILNYSRTAIERLADVSHDEFMADIDKQLAVTHLVMIVGEAAAQVSEERRKALPQVPWAQIIGTRNKIVHHYFKVDLQVIWDIVQNDLPMLVSQLEPEFPARNP